MHRGSGRIGDAMIVMPSILVLVQHPNRLEGRTPLITRTIANRRRFGCVLKNALKMNFFRTLWKFHCLRDCIY